MQRSVAKKCVQNRSGCSGLIRSRGSNFVSVGANLKLVGFSCDLHVGDGVLRDELSHKDCESTCQIPPRLEAESTRREWASVKGENFCS